MNYCCKFLILALVVCSFANAKTSVYSTIVTNSKPAFKACGVNDPSFQKNALSCLKATVLSGPPGPSFKCPKSCSVTISDLINDPICQKAVLAVCPFLRAHASGANATVHMLQTMCPS